MAKIITKDSRPGKGIDKNEPEKRRFFLFFELFFSKISKLILLNFIYFVTLLPLIMGIYYSVLVNPLIENAAGILKYPPFIFTPTKVGTILLVVSIFITGPATAGFTYVIRNMQRREHSWVLSDFFEHAKKNYLQGIITSAVDMVCCIVLYVALAFYLYIMPVDAPELGTALPMMGAMFVVAISIVFIWAHFYLYTMMVTFKLDYGKLFKNSLIFAIAKLPLNILISIILGIIIVPVVWSVVTTSLIAGLLFPVILLSLAGFIIIFSTYPSIDKTMIQKVNKRVLNTRG